MMMQRDFVQFSVKDKGVGLNTEDQIRVFEPFFQVESSLSRNYGGTGLGLTICRGIIEAQKGKIWVESKPGFGSTFYFTVPLKPVYDIEPIKVLFSQKAEIENKIRTELMNSLGPMGEIEFNDLKNKRSLNKDDLMKYITSLENQNVLRHTHADEFRRNIGYIFGDENRKENQIETEKEWKGEVKVKK
jgi:hypothetical protein